MTTDTVTAADLAAALREAVPFVMVAGNYYQRLHLDAVSETIQDLHMHKMYAADDVQAKARHLLDRWDAQCREELEALLIHEKELKWACMGFARAFRLHGEADGVRRNVQGARAANHRILNLKRQLRALGGDV